MFCVKEKILNAFMNVQSFVEQGLKVVVFSFVWSVSVYFLLVWVDSHILPLRSWRIDMVCFIFRQHSQISRFGYFSLKIFTDLIMTLSAEDVRKSTFKRVLHSNFDFCQNDIVYWITSDSLFENGLRAYFRFKIFTCWIYTGWLVKRIFFIEKSLYTK